MSKNRGHGHDDSHDLDQTVRALTKAVGEALAKEIHLLHCAVELNTQAIRESTARCHVGGLGTITDEEIERIEDMSASAPFTLYENQKSIRKVTLTKTDGSIDTTSAFSVRSDNASQVTVEKVADDAGVPSRKYRVLTPGEGAYSATITVTAPGFPANTVVCNVLAKVNGQIVDEQDSDPESDE